MCIAYLALGHLPEWPLFIAANRDEFHNRPARRAGPWSLRPDIIAGKDLQGGGTWLGVTDRGRFGLLTNYRDPGHQRPHAPSRGALVSDYLAGDLAPKAYVRHVAQEGDRYNGFNLIVGDLDGAWYVSNRADRSEPVFLAPGSRHVLSNHLLDTPWPKSERLRNALDALPCESLQGGLAPVFDILRDDTRATVDRLPHTGLEPERELLLSSPFIVSPGYGTRSSSVILIHRSGQALHTEVTHDVHGAPLERHDWPFEIHAGDPKV